MIRIRSDVSFWIQTKRARRIQQCLPFNWNDGWENVILCVTTENQKRADERLPILLDIPAKHKAFMIAPILSEVHVESYLATKQFEQVLCDGENYDGNRPCRYEWVKSLHDQCERKMFDLILSEQAMYLSKMEKFIEYRKHTKVYRQSVLVCRIRLERLMFQYSRDAKLAKEDTVVMDAIGVENVS